MEDFEEFNMLFALCRQHKATKQQLKTYFDKYASYGEKKLNKLTFDMTNEELLECEILDENNEVGDLNLVDGVDCPICKNKGFVYVKYGNNKAEKSCKCMVTRNFMKSLKNSGMADLLKKYNFNTYKAEEDWQKRILTKAQKYSQEKKGWFALFGQSGIGKTHICTSIVQEFAKEFIPCKYMVWVSVCKELKQLAMDRDEYQKVMNVYKSIPVLYIDDFLKTENKDKPTSADVNIAFEIINDRYNSQKITIISSEWLINELINIDEALGSRIKEMCKGYLLQLKSGDRNYRLK